MPYSFPKNIPKVSLNWVESEQKRCTAAANAVLSDGGSEQSAIFACIRAAGKTEHPGGEDKEGSMSGLTKMLAWVDKTLFGEDTDKAVLSASRRNKLLDSDFAYIDSDGERHLPMHDAAHVRNAIARFNQTQFESSTAKQQAWRKIVARAKKLGVDVSGGKAIDDESIEGNSIGGFNVHKQADGSYRWVSVVSNYYRDRDKPPEIISGKAHREYVAYTDRTGDYPDLWFWHLLGSKVGKADWLDFFDGFLVASGTFDKDSDSVAEKLSQHPDPLTVSHGFKRLSFDKPTTTTNAYRMKEISILPVRVEANPWTDFSTLKEDAMSMSPQKRAILAQFLPEEKLDAIEQVVKELRVKAEASGVDWKALLDEPPEGSDSNDTDKATTEPIQVDVKALALEVAEALQLKALSDTLTEIKARLDSITSLENKIKALEGAMTHLRQSDDAKVAQAMTARNVDGLNLAWMNKAASQRKDTVLDPEDDQDAALGEDKPAVLQFLDAALSGMPGRI